MSEGICVAILGATGAVGTELIELLESRRFPVRELRLLASPRSAGRQLQFRGQNLSVRATTAEEFAGVDLVLASAGSSTTKARVQEILAAGATIVDNSSAFRMDREVPLVVPEINPSAAARHRGIVANPNCSTILMAVAVYPLHRVRPLRRLVVATYQSASGAGAKAMEEVKAQAQAILNGETPPTEVFPYPLAFNVFPHNSPLNEQGYCQEEIKMVEETRKIFDAPQLQISATCVRVPVLRAHSEAVNIEFSNPFPVAEAREILAKAPGIELREDWQANYFPMPIAATGRDEVLVGRLRQDMSCDRALELWLSGDQIRKGAALNAVQIAELLVKHDWLHPRQAALA